ncbi:hypothetical protein SOPP22_05990 [Shewanella sp. OPT22]|nr:hypothetical protein SOPP22_05990 [Shewanella sp. OPT22]
MEAKALQSLPQRPLSATDSTHRTAPNRFSRGDKTYKSVRVPNGPLEGFSRTEKDTKTSLLRSKSMKYSVRTEQQVGSENAKIQQSDQERLQEILNYDHDDYTSRDIIICINDGCSFEAIKSYIKNVTPELLNTPHNGTYPLEVAYLKHNREMIDALINEGATLAVLDSSRLRTSLLEHKDFDGFIDFVLRQNPRIDDVIALLESGASNDVILSFINTCQQQRKFDVNVLVEGKALKETLIAKDKQNLWFSILALPTTSVTVQDLHSILTYDSENNAEFAPKVIENQLAQRLLPIVEIDKAIDGKSILHIACESGFISTASELVALGANPEMPSCEQKNLQQFLEQDGFLPSFIRHLAARRPTTFHQLHALATLNANDEQLSQVLIELSANLKIDFNQKINGESIADVLAKHNRIALLSQLLAIDSGLDTPLACAENLSVLAIKQNKYDLLKAIVNVPSYHSSVAEINKLVALGCDTTSLEILLVRLSQQNVELKVSKEEVAQQMSELITKKLISQSALLSRHLGVEPESEVVSKALSAAKMKAIEDKDSSGLCEVLTHPQAALQLPDLHHLIAFKADPKFIEAQVTKWISQDKDEDIDTKVAGKTLLAMAALGALDDLAAILIRSGADPDFMLPGNYSLIHKLTSTNCIEALTAAVSIKGKQCVLSVRGIKNETALHMACRQSSKEVVQLMLRIGGDDLLKNKNEDGQTPMIILASRALYEPPITTIFKEHLISSIANTHAEKQEIERTQREKEFSLRLHKTGPKIGSLLDKKMALYQGAETIENTAETLKREFNLYFGTGDYESPEVELAKGLKVTKEMLELQLTHAKQDSQTYFVQLDAAKHENSRLKAELEALKSKQ